ncbi:sugar epimerase [Nonlabens antarcticus]|uniref:sugar epimerase n=1 Tax=Nonlabens antarcticus TaxID=392714 RepID=UPI0018919852|nr:sugar epimerase [Nonlabens antarcticus]
MKKLVFTKGGFHIDNRGTINFNNNFDATAIKRMYLISNSVHLEYRRWQGHKIESRWFSNVIGEVEIQVIHIDDWNQPDKNLPVKSFKLKGNGLDILYVPNGYVTSIKCNEALSKVLVMSDHALDEVDDEYKFPTDYFFNAN